MWFELYKSKKESYQVIRTQSTQETAGVNVLKCFLLEVTI